MGSHLIDRLVKMGAEVFAVDNLSYGIKGNINAKASFLNIDITKYNKFRNIIADIDPDVLYHLAAIATTKENELGWKDPVQDYLNNAVGTLNVFSAVAGSYIDPKIIYTSSAAVYGNPEYVPIDEAHPTNPISPYGISKLAGEKYAQAYYDEYGIKSTSLRIFNTYGPRQPRYVMFDLMTQLSKKPKELIVLGFGDHIRDYCYISDAVDALILSAEKAESLGECFNVGSGIPTSIEELARKLMDVFNLGGEAKVRYTKKSWKGDIPRLVADVSRIKSKLQFEPKVRLDNGIAKLYNWFTGICTSG